MHDRIRSRRAWIAAGFAGYAILAAGSYDFGGSGGVSQALHLPSGVTIAQIIQAAQLVSALLAEVQKTSGLATQSVTTGYEELAQFLREQRLTSKELTAMEKALGGMQQKRTKFSESLNATSRQADKLFGMLESRARDLGNEAMRDRLLEDVAKKKSEFSLRVDRASNGLLKLDSSIKKYDDILGYLQVKKGLEGVGQYAADVDQIIAQSAALSQEIQVAVQEGMKIVDPGQFR